MVEYLIRLLQHNYRLAVLSRGYGRRTKGFLLADRSKDNASSLGDESAQYLRKFNNLMVAVDENRRRGIDRLLSIEKSPEVVVLDDAFQHRRVLSGCSVLLTPYDDLYVDDFMLPTGNLREPVIGAQRAQIIVVTKCPPNLDRKEMKAVLKVLKVKDGQQVFFSRINYDDKIFGEDTLPLRSLTTYQVLLLTGIANPKPLLDHLTKHEIKFKHLRFPDHHRFTRSDLDKINAVFDTFERKNRIILTTEKDYVRIFGRLKTVYYLPIAMEFLDNGTGFDNLICDYVEHDSGNS
jgi:tetraacyldisaccharide 4'-kinase